MSSSKKPQTIGYWYRPLIHFGLWQGPIDALLEFRGGDRTAWKGRLEESGEFYVDAMNLWGGESSEGGIAGYCDFMNGDADQEPNAYLTAKLGPMQPGYRGVSSIVFKGGRYGAMNPYPKPASFKGVRTLKGWDDDAPWYPVTAAIPLGAERAPVEGTWAWVNRSVNYFVIGAAQELSGAYASYQGWWKGNIDCFRITKGVARYAATTYPVPTTAFGGDGEDPYYDDVVLLLRMLGADGATTFTDDKGHDIEANGGAYITTSRSKFGGSSAYFNGVTAYLIATMDVDQDLGSGPWTMDAWVWLESALSDAYSRALFGYGPVNVGASDTAWYCVGDAWHYDQLEAGNLHRPGVIQNTEPFMETGRWAFVSICWDGQRYWMHQDGQLLTASSTLLGMNPAHIIYDSLASVFMQGEPVESINDASFRAAAELFYSEGFGLCTEYSADQETVEEFRQRICNVVAARCSRSRVDGLWYLDPIRGDFDIGALPELTDDDILEFEEQASTLDDAVNQVTVQWFDPTLKESRTTPPVQALGAILAAGAVNPEVLQFPELAVEGLSNRVGTRELHARATPLRRLKLVCNRTPYAWRIGTRFVIRAPRKGIQEMVCLVGDIDTGTLRSGAVTLVAVQDAYAMPDASYVSVQPPQDTDDPVPRGSPQQRLVELPYVELVATLSHADLAAIPPAVGYIGAIATAPRIGQNYSLYTHGEGEDFGEGSLGNWCPAATLNEAADYLATDFTVAAQSNLALAEVGSRVLWEQEECRLVAMDPEAGTITLARGCADTVPERHAPGTVLYFYDQWHAVDGREYAEGETVSAKLLSRTATQVQSPDEAPTLTREIVGRFHRPYPPARFRINGQSAVESANDEVVVEWRHRDRVLQGDQLLESEAESVGPELGTTYNVRWFIGEQLEHSETGITGTTASWLPTSAGVLRVEVESERDGLVSFQMQVRTLVVGSVLLSEAGAAITDENDQPILME